MQHAVGSPAHAVHGPLGVAVFVADGDRETAVVGAYEVNHVTRVTLHVEGWPLAGVGCAVPGLFWKEIEKKLVRKKSNKAEGKMCFNFYFSAIKDYYTFFLW